MSDPNKTILIPISVKAWIITADTLNIIGRYKDISLDYTDINSFNGNDLQSGDVFFEKPLSKNDLGIHLHWSLPHVFKHGTHHQDKLHFPAVPNRWLITRFFEGSHKQWLIASDHIGPDGTNSWVTEEKGDFKPTRIGKAFNLPADVLKKAAEGKPLSDKEKQALSDVQNAIAGLPKPAQPLTAIAPGNAMFSANYWGAKNVFGFHDDGIAALPQGAVSYSVMGWYSDGTHDPFQSISPTPIINNELLKLRNEFIAKSCKLVSFGKPDGGAASRLKEINISQPAQSLCHAAIHDIPWKMERIGLYLNEPVSFTLARNIKEALSVEIAHKLEAPHTEPFITALLGDHLKNTADVTDINALLHAQNFDPVESGFTWEITARFSDEQKKNKLLKYFPDELSFADKADYPKLLSLFDKINHHQENWNKLERERRSLLVTLREIVDKLNVLITETANLSNIAYPEDIKNLAKLLPWLTTNAPHYAPTVNNLCDTLKNVTAALNKINDDENTCKINICTLSTDDGGSIVVKPGIWCAEIEQLLKKCVEKEKGIYQLSRKKTNDFFGPAEPVVLVRLPDNLKPAEKYQPKAGDTILCRTPDQVYANLQYSSNHQPNRSVTSGMDSLLDVIKLLPAALQQTVRHLLTETHLLNPNGFAADNTGDDSINNDEAVITGALANYYSGVVADGSPSIPLINAFKDRVPLSAADHWKFLCLLGNSLYTDNWYPVFMLWGVDWYADKNTILPNQPKALTRQAAQIHQSDKVVHTYNGQGVINAVSPENFIRKLNNDVLHPGYVYLSQSIGGLFDHLLMKKRAVNIPVSKSPVLQVSDLGLNESYLRHPGEYAFPVLPAHQLANSSFQDKVNWGDESFFPLTQGNFKFKNLWLTDGFGRIKKLVDHRHVVAAHTRASISMATTQKDAFSLSTAFVQPTRLSFEWMAAGAKVPQPSTSDPATTPVYAWLLFNQANNSLSVFDDKSTSLGELIYQKKPKTAFYWQPSPHLQPIKNKADFNDEITNNTRLHQFLKYLKNNPDKWDLLTSAIKHVSQNAVTEKDPEIADLIGVPLALVNARLQLEFFGYAAQPQKWQYGPSAPLNSTAYYDKLEVKALLGNTGKRKNGLLGYFKGDDEKFFSCNFDINKKIYFEEEQISLKPTEILSPAAAKPTAKAGENLTMLIYPHAGVYATTGILPPAYVELADTLIAKGLRMMEPAIAVNPIIGNLNEPGIAVSNEADHKWIWETRSLTANKEMLITEMEIKTNAGASSDEKDSDLKGQSIIEGYLKLRKTDV